jgi:hypothetical protein
MMTVASGLAVMSPVGLKTVFDPEVAVLPVPTIVPWAPAPVA